MSYALWVATFYFSFVLTLGCFSLSRNTIVSWDGKLQSPTQLCHPRDGFSYVWRSGQDGVTFPACCAWDEPQVENNEPQQRAGTHHWLLHPKHNQSKMMLHSGWSAFGKFNQVGGHACACRDKGVSFRNIALSARSCLLKWDPQHFCKSLGPNGILFVGDSLMQQTASVLMNHVLADGRGFDVKNCLERILYGLSDGLTLQENGSSERGATLKDYVEYVKPSVVVVSTGPHIKDVAEFKGVVRGVLDVTSSFKSTLFIWKTHYKAGCHISDDAHNWALFDKFDEHIWSVWNTSRILNMDAYKHVQHMHVCDRGEYVDAMHYCIPGPLDSIPMLLYTLLRTLE